MAATRSRGATFLLWLRRTHLYVGLWGALMGLLFGITGILLNHRSVLRIPVEKAVTRTVQVPPAPAALASPEALAEWLRSDLGYLPVQVVQVRRHPPQEVRWGDRDVRQPERWTVMLQQPRRAVNAEYFVGNALVRLDHLDATVVGWLTRLHMSVGATAAWVLLADTIAGALVLLCVTGLLLWSRLNRIRLAACVTAMGAVAVAVALSAL
ncbi:MAG TPA: PepSY-associated TM helix domain-containing protein [Usitatibacter sp.]|nr:PepSY-associated TM helix domain-containing protein [Usitatibacter sp.]